MNTATNLDTLALSPLKDPSFRTMRAIVARIVLREKRDRISPQELRLLAGMTHSEFYSSDVSDSKFDSLIAAMEEEGMVGYNGQEGMMHFTDEGKQYLGRYRQHCVFNA